MRKTLITIDALCLTFLSSLIAVSVFFGLSQDLLLFHSDPAALAHFFLTMSLILTAALTLPVGIGAWFAKDGGFLRWFSVLILAQILFGFLIHFLDGHPVFHFTLNLLEEHGMPTGRLGVFGVVSLGLLAACFGIACGLSRLSPYHARVLLLSRGAAAAGLAFLILIPGLRFFTDSPAGASKEDRRNVVLIVLDGLSTRYLAPYNPEENTPEFAALAQEGVLYTNVRTNFTHTSGFFYALHSGQRRSWADPGKNKQEGLLQMLQAAGVNTRWFTYHNNGVPDVHHIPYRGVRSSFLKSRFSSILRPLHVDYNVFERTGAQGRGKAMGRRESAIQEWLAGFDRESWRFPLERWALDEIHSLRADPRPFFMIVHLPPSALAGTETGPKTWELEAEDSVPAERLQRVRQKILKDQDYTYAKEDAWAVDILRDEYRDSVRQGTRSLQKFLQAFRENGWHEDTLVLVTADHGKIMSRGKVEYGFHNDEEVARVPLLVMWQDRKGIDERLGESIDLPQTVLEFFQIEGRLSPHAVSLLGEAQKPWTSTLTTWSFKRKEWFFNVYQGGHRYVFNLYPKNTSVRKEKISGLYRTQRVPMKAPLSAELGFELKEVLDLYGIRQNPDAAVVWDLVKGP